MENMFFTAVVVSVCVVVLCVAAMIGHQVFIISSDAINTRSVSCENITVNETTMSVEYGSISLYVVVNSTPRYLLDIADEGVPSEWKLLKHNDTIQARLGERSIEFCGVVSR